MASSAQKTGARKIVFAVALSAAGFVLGSAAIHATIRHPLDLHADIRSEKLYLMQQWHGTVFSAAFGSSHVHDGFDAAAFDRAVAGTPLATAAANFAVEGGSQTEQRAMALRFVRQLESPASAGAPSQPCLVMLELAAGANIGTNFLVHPRAINLYDWDTTRFALHYSGAELSRRQRYGRAGYGFEAMALHEMNVGMLSNLIFAPPLSEKELAEESGDGRLGHRELVTPASVQVELRNQVAGMPRTPKPEQVPVSPGAYRLVEDIAAASAVRNLTFAYVVMPSLSNLRDEPEYPDHISVNGRDVPIINMAQPERFAQLYDPALWRDDVHLNVTGSAMASELIARQLTAWYALHGQPARCGGE